MDKTCGYEPQARCSIHLEVAILKKGIYRCVINIEDLTKEEKKAFLDKLRKDYNLDREFLVMDICFWIYFVSVGISLGMMLIAIVK